MNQPESRIDLHVHTSYGDGELSPSQVLQRARVNGVGVISITEHDTLAPYDDKPSIFDEAKHIGIELIPGIELSTTDYRQQRFHILGYEFDTGSLELRGWLTDLAAARKEYAENVSQKLIDGGWGLETTRFMGRAVITKAHIADAVVENPANFKRLINEYGEIPNRGKFIETMLNQGGPFYTLRKAGPRPEMAVEMIHRAGGIAVLAHPVSCLYEQDMTIEDIEDVAINSRVDGLEAIYYYFSKSMDDRKVSRVKQFKSLAEKLNLIVTGGSDYHGDSQTLGRFTEIGMPGEAIVPDMSDVRELRRRTGEYR